MATGPWNAHEKAQAIARGSHKYSHGERAFVATEILDFVQQGYWLVLPYHVVAAWPNLCISPLGVVPQRDRRPRLIVDYSFSGVNIDTAPLALREAMQFCRALQRILSAIVHADPRYGPVQQAKIDIADGFYRVWLSVADVPKLGVVLPTAPGCTPLIAFPLALPMGWVKSPLYLTSFTETACDLAKNDMLAANHPRLHCVHRLEAGAATPPAEGETLPPATTTHRATAGKISGKQLPLGAVDVYVDDFLLLAQTKHQQQRVLRAALTAIDDVFRPLEDSNPVTRKEPSSVKKMLKGDASGRLASECWAGMWIP